MKIRTKYVTSASGQGQIRARGVGKQRTIAYDHDLSVGCNHANAAYALIQALPVAVLSADNVRVEAEVFTFDFTPDA